MNQHEESEYVKQARQVGAAISTEADLVAFDARFCEPEAYMVLSEKGLREVEDIRASALRRIYGVDW